MVQSSLWYEMFMRLWPNPAACVGISARVTFHGFILNITAELVIPKASLRLRDVSIICRAYDFGDDVVFVLHVFHTLGFDVVS